MLPWKYSLASAAAKSRQSCPVLCNPIDGGPPGSRPWDSPGKHTGGGCHFLLQCMEVKSEREVTQSCLTLCNPVNCSLPGSSVHRISQARVLEWAAIAFSATQSRDLDSTPVSLRKELSHCGAFILSILHTSIHLLCTLKKNVLPHFCRMGITVPPPPALSIY